MTRAHTGMFIARLITEKLREYDISLDQIYSLTTDNGSNMLKVVSILAESAKDGSLRNNSEQEEDNDIDLDLLADQMELFQIGKSIEAQSQTFHLDHEDQLTNDNGDEVLHECNFNVASQIFLCDNKHIKYLMGINCGAHTLQLEVIKSINQWECKYQLLSKCRIIMTKLRTPNILNIMATRSLNFLILDCLTRWNSIYDMVRKFLYF